MTQLLTTPSNPATSATAPLVETRDLSKRYGARVLALDSLTLTIGGGVTGLVGANGAGKSTLIKILLGLLARTAGSAFLFGFDVRDPGPRSLRQFVGYMPEHDCLPPDVSATDFVAHMAQISGIPRAAARERTAEMLRHVGLFEERYRAIGGYSTGMKQRVKLAQALVHDPRLLMLDEPTNGLDPAGRDEMLDLIRRIGAEFEIAILMSSHLLGEIERVCDNLVVIDAGRLMRADTISSFTSSLQVLADRGGRDAGRACWTVEVARAARDTGRPPDPDRASTAISPTTSSGTRSSTCGVGLLRLEQRRHRLEDLFRPEVGDAEWLSAAPSRRQHLRPRLSPLRRRPAGTRLRHRVSFHLQPAGGLRTWQVGLEQGLPLRPCRHCADTGGDSAGSRSDSAPGGRNHSAGELLRLRADSPGPVLRRRRTGDHRPRPAAPHAAPVFLARARPQDYVAAKVGALFVALLLVSIFPQAILFLGSAVATEDLVGYLQDNAG